MREQRESVDKLFLTAQNRFKVLMKMASKTFKWKGKRPLARIENFCLRNEDLQSRFGWIYV